METAKPMQGTWTLVSPDNRVWIGASPLQCAAMEQRERVPADVAMARIQAAADETPDPLYDAMKRIVRTPAMPFPDAGAHSHTAFYQAVHHAYIDIQRIAREALAAAVAPAQPAKEQA